MTRLERKKLSIDGYCHNKQAIYTYSSFFKRERQHDPFRAKEIINRGKKLSIEGYCHNKQARYTRIPRSLSVSDNMTRLERKKLSIEGYCSNKLARYTRIARSLSVSDNMTRLERKKLSIEGRNYELTKTATTNKPDIHVYLVL